MVDRKIEVHVKNKYGLHVKHYASGTNMITGMREMCFDVVDNDGEVFVVDAQYNPTTGDIITTERELI